MEPLNSYRLNKIMLLALGCVDVAMYAASGHFAKTGSGNCAFCGKFWISHIKSAVRFLLLFTVQIFVFSFV